ncbi:MAG: hypothetical protein ACOY3L_06465 [Pseudomonadota bacterium]
MLHRAPAAAFMLATVLLAAGCTREYKEEPAPPVAVQPSEPTTVAEPAPPAPVPMPAPVFPIPQQKPTPGTSIANLPPQFDQDDPQRLVGLDEAQTSAILGDPFIAEERPPARIWTYADGDCRLQVFFYPDLSDQHFAALTFSFSGIQDTEAARRGCFAALLEKHGA